MPAVPVDCEPGCTKLPEAEDTGTPMAAEPRSFCVRDMLALTLPTPTLPVVAAVVLEALEVAEFVAGCRRGGTEVEEDEIMRGVAALTTLRLLLLLPLTEPLSLWLP